MTDDRNIEPLFTAPPLSCDAHFHVFGPADRYPHGGVNEKLRYAPPLAPLEDYLVQARRLGFERFVFVQPSAYGRDNAYMLDAMGRNVRFLEGEGPKVDPATRASELANVPMDRILSKLSPVGETVERVRAQLPGFTYVLLSSTHNHEGPDTLGLWGPSPFASGVDPEYVRHVEGQIVRAVRQAEAAARQKLRRQP